MIRVLSFHQKEVHFETSFNLAVFSKATKIEFVERGTRSAGGGSITARNEGLAPWYRMSETELTAGVLKKECVSKMLSRSFCHKETHIHKNLCRGERSYFKCTNNVTPTFLCKPYT